MTTALVRVGKLTYTRGAYVDRWGHKHPAKKVTRKGHTRTVKRKGKRRVPKAERWYRPKVKMGWKKGSPQTERRRAALKAHTGDALAAGRALQALVNVTTDRETKIEARKDALYFFALAKKN